MPWLAAGMREYQRIQSAWKPGVFRQVEVGCREIHDGARDEAAYRWLAGLEPPAPLFRLSEGGSLERCESPSIHSPRSA